LQTKGKHWNWNTIEQRDAAHAAHSKSQKTSTKITRVNQITYPALAVALAIKLPRSRLLLSVKPEMLIAIGTGAVEPSAVADVVTAASGSPATTDSRGADLSGSVSKDDVDDDDDDDAAEVLTVPEGAAPSFVETASVVGAASAGGAADEVDGGAASAGASVGELTAELVVC
jgi:hypothetical protein